MKILRLLVVPAVVFASSCAAPVTTPVFSPRLDPQAKYVAERSTLSNPATASIRELALSLPVYESKNLTSADSETGPNGNSWRLLGDGAQRPVAVKRLTAADANPVRLRVYLGGRPAIEPADYGSIYELEKVPGGWKVLTVKEGSSATLYRWPME